MIILIPIALVIIMLAVFYIDAALYVKREMKQEQGELSLKNHDWKNFKNQKR
ncbi:MAG TPA: hypothetical protein VNG53_02095 [Bacteroidia bacterium]|nr:hypothetical protein [Bacteroidia bacterium]